MNFSKELDFHFNTQNVRVLVDEKGHPWFVAKDVAEILGYKDVHKAIKAHCRGVGDLPIPSSGGLQMTKIINRHDLIRLCIKSKLPSAEKFEKWAIEVIDKVLETGSYGVEKALEETLNDPRKMAAYFIQLAEAQDKNLELESKLQIVTHEIEMKDRQIIETIPKVKYHDEVLSADGTMTITEIAKGLGVSGMALNKLLQDRNVIYKRGKNWFFYSEFQNQGLGKMITMSVTKKPNEPKQVVTHLR